MMARRNALLVGIGLAGIAVRKEPFCTRRACRRRKPLGNAVDHTGEFRKANDAPSEKIADMHRAGYRPPCDAVIYCCMGLAQCARLWASRRKAAYDGVHIGGVRPSFP
jgi:hypothetical protein